MGFVDECRLIHYHAGMLNKRVLRIVLGVIIVLAAGGCNFSQAIEVLLATQTPTPTQTPLPTATATPTPTPPPTPTPLPPAIADEADQALLNGDWDQALAIYQGRLGSSADPQARAAAQLGIGVTLMRAGDFDGALLALNLYLEQYPEDQARWKAFFLRAVQAERAGLDEAALADFDAYLALHPGLLDSFIHEKAGDALRRLGRPLQAVARFEQAAAAPRLGSIAGVLLKIGRAYLEAGEWGAALETFDRVYDYASDGPTRATANLLAGQTLERLGDPQAAHARYLDSVNNYPAAYNAYIGLIALVEAGVPVDEFQRGLVDFNAGAYGPAISAFDRLIAQQPSGSAHYYRGLSSLALGDLQAALSDFTTAYQNYPEDAQAPKAWVVKAETQWTRLDRGQEAIDTYLAFVAAMPGDAQASGALFDAGRIAERLNDLEQAAEIWLRIPQEYPGSRLAYQGALEAGVVEFRLENYSAALSAFNLAVGMTAEHELRAKAMLWSGKSFAALGDHENALLAWNLAAGEDPSGYYSIRAADLIANRAPFEPAGRLDFNFDIESERRSAEVWMRATFGLTQPGALEILSEELMNDARMQRGDELWQLGEFELARNEYEALRKSYTDDAQALYRLMYKFLELPLYRSAILSARQILALAGMDEVGGPGAQLYLNRVRFGVYYPDLILPAADSRGIDRLLLLALIRQESLFEGFATSYASAHGLMQVIPPTGDWIYSRLGWPQNYTSADLYRPLVSVRYGTYYLALQLESFDQDPYAALAAYNAGPGNAQVWKALAPQDFDLYLEVVRLTQPHSYIKVIYEVYTIYRQLYSAN